MLNTDYQMTTEIEDLKTACVRAGYNIEDINYLIEGLQDSCRANARRNNEFIYEAGKILTRYGQFTSDRILIILSKFTGKSTGYVNRVRNSTEFSLKSA